MKKDTCGCCETAKIIPLKIDNRPGLSAIAFRSGSFATFREALLNSIAGIPALRHLKTRLSDDYSITILELWSIVADILTFYQERIANEGFIRTARQRDSILRLARLIDYHLGPGAAATTLLAFTVENDAKVTIPAGLRVQSVPGQDEQPQKFETMESISANFRWNRLRIYPRPQKIDNLTNRKEVFLSPGDEGLRIAKMLSIGDQVVLFDKDAGNRFEELVVDRVDLEGEHMFISWKTPILRDWKINTDAYKYTRKFRHFGVDAPAQFVKPSLPEIDRHIIYFDNGSTKLKMRYVPTLKHIVSVLKQYPVLRLIIEGHQDRSFNDINTSFERAKKIATWLKNKEIDEERLQIKDFKDSKPIADFGKPEGVKNCRVEIAPIPLAAEEFEWKLQSTDFMRDSDNALELDAVYEDLKRGAKLLIVIQSESDIVVKLCTVDKTSLVSASRGPLSDSVTKVALDQTIQNFDIRNVTIYELSEPIIRFWGYKYGPHITEASVYIPGNIIDEDKIEIDRSIENYQYQSGVEVSRNDLELGRKVVLLDDQSEPVSAVISSVSIDPNTGSQGYLVLDFIPDSEINLDRASAVLLGNITTASHGESIPREVIGDGDAASRFQEFSLQKKPVTFVSAAVPGGLENSLNVMVNGALWKEVYSLSGKSKTDPVYTTRIDNEGTMSVQFGDGITGARLPTGRGNIVATYRQGIGLAGRVGGNRLTTLLDQPVGLKSVTNPIPADGGADPEKLDQARKNAPITVRTFNRAISLKDFKDLATASGIAAKALATWVWSNERRVVYLTVAGQKGGRFTETEISNIYNRLTAQRDPNIGLIIDNFQPVSIVIGGLLRLDNGHVSTEIVKKAREALISALSFEALEFGQTIHLSDIYKILQDVEGVASVDINLFHFKDLSSIDLVGRGADSKAVQKYLRIFPALPGRGPSLPAIPAEQARIEDPVKDIQFNTSGGMTL